MEDESEVSEISPSEHSPFRRGVPSGKAEVYVIMFPRCITVLSICDVTSVTRDESEEDLEEQTRLLLSTIVIDNPPPYKTRV